jgi:hypothetical protein
MLGAAVSPHFPGELVSVVLGSALGDALGETEGPR